jgi:hydroxymethylbilane synthase
MNRHLQGGCQVPIACYAIHTTEGLWLRGLVGAPSGALMLYDEIRGNVDDGETMGIALAEKLLAAGADKILAEVYQSDLYGSEINPNADPE